jgi:anti-sigma factor RsiW
MKQDIQLKLQAYLDGELPPAEARDMADLIARDSQSRELLTELTNTRAAITTCEADIKVPATREFYWSGIRREIERQEKSANAHAEEVPILTLLRRMLVPASGLLAVVLAVVLAGQQFRSTAKAVVEETDTTFADAGAFTYRDYDSGTTLVWVDYPAENEFAEVNTDDTLDFD